MLKYEPGRRSRSRSYSPQKGSRSARHSRSKSRERRGRSRSRSQGRERERERDRDRDRSREKLKRRYDKRESRRFERSRSPKSRKVPSNLGDDSFKTTSGLYVNLKRFDE